MNVRGGLPGKILVELAGVTYEVDSGGNAYEALHALAGKVNEAVDVVPPVVPVVTSMRSADEAVILKAAGLAAK